MSGALLVGGILLCCFGHPWIGGFLIFLGLRLWAGEQDERPAGPYRH